MNKSDIEIICNYQEQSSQINPNTKLSYLDFSDYDSEDYINEVKRRKRDITIDVILSNEPNQESTLSQGLVYGDNTSQYGMMSVMSHSIGIGNKIGFNSYDALWLNIITHIESSSKNKHSYISSNNIHDLKYNRNPSISELENIMSFGSKIESRISLLSNLLASINRRGSATFAIVGSNVLQYLNNLHPYVSKNKDIIGNLSGIIIVKSHLISPNKIILGRSESNIDGGGLIVRNDLQNYYMFETPNTFYKNFIWFDII